MPTVAPAQAGTSHTHVFVTAGELTWNDFAPSGFPSGGKIAIVHGDPGSDGPYTIRISLPDGYVIPAHYHSMDETLTVLSGVFQIAMGDRRDEQRLQSFRAGDVLFFPAGEVHFGGVQGPTVVQLHGIGPFTTTVVEPIDSGPATDR
jgi:quercetin dioxygenase-like cupin family protein